MRINFKFFRLFSKSLRIIIKKSVFKSLSCTYNNNDGEVLSLLYAKKYKMLSRPTSSTNMCETAARSGSHCSLRRSIPVVHNKSRVFEVTFFSNLIEYPHVSPTFSVLSCDIRSDTPIALIRLGCVTMMFVNAPCPFKILSSRTSCGTWVVLPRREFVRKCLEDDHQ